VSRRRASKSVTRLSLICGAPYEVHRLGGGQQFAVTHPPVHFCDLFPPRNVLHGIIIFSLESTLFSGTLEKESHFFSPVFND